MAGTRIKHPQWIRWSLFIYSLFAFLISILYIASHFYFFKINWIKYSTDKDYNARAEKILKYGVARIRGNELSLHSPLLIGLLIIGIIIAIALFIFAWRTYYAKTFTPLIALTGFIIPLIPLGTNALITLIIGYILVLVGSGLSVAALKLL